MAVTVSSAFGDAPRRQPLQEVDRTSFCLPEGAAERHTALSVSFTVQPTLDAGGEGRDARAVSPPRAAPKGERRA